MTATALIGLQWGDEGKGKVVDLMAKDFAWVVRCQGGSNAGHTVKVDGETTVLHLIPSGILSPSTRCAIGNGVVVDPEQLVVELDDLAARGVDVAGRLVISERAHVVFPHHKERDTRQESSRGDSARIGTTGRGIGPAYEDKAARCGLRMWELLDEEILAPRLVALGSRGPGNAEAVAALIERLRPAIERIRPFVGDAATPVQDALESGSSVLLEGAQGALLDLDHGTYPYVTSSNTVVGGLLTGGGIGSRALERVVGVIKAYCTRVGEGPFPTELEGEVGDRIRDRGAEYGATTGRPRRCGWFDAVATRSMVRANGVNELVITKADVLSGFDEVMIATGYSLDGRSLSAIPADPRDIDRLEIEYLSHPGWSEDISAVRDHDRLPSNLKKFVSVVEKLCGARVTMVSVGPGREDVVWRPGGIDDA